MNKKLINELAEKAYFLIENDKIFAPDAFDSINVELLDFAQLIIQECIDQVGYFEYGPDGEQSEFAMDVLRSHFGVE